MLYFENCNLYTKNKIIKQASLTVDKLEIIEIITDKKFSNSKAINLNGLNVCTGFIDLQVNGGGGVLFSNNPTIDSLKTIHKAHLLRGTTHILPTLISSDVETMQKAGTAVANYIEQGNKGILGIHFEGPFIDVGSRGTHKLENIRKPTPKDIGVIIDTNAKLRSLGAITMLTLAPEIIDLDLIKYFCDNGIFVYIGHSDAGYDLMEKCYEIGVCGVTHLYNAMSNLSHREKSTGEPGIVNFALSNDDVYATIIMDGYHVVYSSAKVAYRSKPQGKLLLVSDSLSIVGSDARTRFKMLGKEIQINEHGACKDEQGILSGGSITIIDAVENCHKSLDIPVELAIKMGSEYPAKALNKKDIGCIEKGYKANLVIFDNNFNIKGVVLEGRYTEIK